MGGLNNTRLQTSARIETPIAVAVVLVVASNMVVVVLVVMLERRPRHG